MLRWTMEPGIQGEWAKSQLLAKRLEVQAANTEAGLSKTSIPSVAGKISLQKVIHGIIWRMERQWYWLKKIFTTNLSTWADSPL
ncbi:hypothetical protein R70723_10295 [Paenibacillus sp. FSL R7-0273]|nr:hypothetical protein R70723_10295 [Paenibacillus sp. FSL R7-0273]